MQLASWCSWVLVKEKKTFWSETQISQSCRGARPSMSVPSMVHRSGDTLVVRSVVSGDTLFDLAQDSSADASIGKEALVFDGKLDLPECKIKRNYSCATCDFFTQNPRDFLYHRRDVHKEKVKIYECPNCLYASKHFQKLLRHSRMVHGAGDSINMSQHEPRKSRKRSLRPPDDDIAVNDEEEPPYENEGEEMSTEKLSVFKCSLCSFSSRNQAQLGRHEREEHIKTKFFRCTKCTYVTHMKARFTKHVKYHTMPMIKCDMCDFRTPYKWNLDRHCKNHNGRGAFKCSACNFTADIKQSLTVHEMNHHVPPVGQAAGLGVGRRRNKVGASDATAAEDAAVQAQVARNEQESNVSVVPRTSQGDDHHILKSKLKQPIKKLKSASAKDQNCANSFGSDFIHPDDIIHHANGNVYIKNKCKLCNYKSAWDSEMAKHEKKMHGIEREGKALKKASRPIPNLIPIPSQTSLHKITSKLNGPPVLRAAEPITLSEPIMSQKDMNEICAKSGSSTLKDLASLFSSEGLFTDCKSETQNSHVLPKVPDINPTIVCPVSSNGNQLDNSFKQKNASFFDKLKEKLMFSAGSSADLICKFCGQESKCLTEQVKHQKQCGKETNTTQNIIPIRNISSSRCQFCRQRCKSSTDLANHLQTCPEAIKYFKPEPKEEPLDGELQIDEDAVENENEIESQPHPMENKVFVWNNIEVPMNIEVDDSNYEYTDDRVDDNVSLDLSIRTQSPGESENSYHLSQDYSIPQHSPAPPQNGEKIPTHGNDISVAQHKRVFKCPHCSFWASTASRFHVHIVGHLNKKPFECSLCAYRSNWRWDITKHIKLKSVRDPAHESAKVLMTDETGRRNYTKYNRYLTEIPVTSDQSMETSGGSGTRPRNQEHHRNSSPGQPELPRLNRAPNCNDFNPLLQRTSPLRPPPALKVADGSFFSKKRPNAENKKTHFKCKKCNFRDASRDILLEHVKGHYPPQSGLSVSVTSSPVQGNIQDLHQELIRGSSPVKDEASVNNKDTPAKGHAPFRCGHCNQVSNWKHVIQRHCRLKHSGDIRVVSNKNGQEKLEVEEHIDEPDHVDLPQEGTFKCKTCPFSNDNHAEFEEHLQGHSPKPDTIQKCYYCKFYVSKQEDLYEHLKLHGIPDPEFFVDKMLVRAMDDNGKKFKCLTCPYVTNSKSQYDYHRKFHRPIGGQYTCTHCSYNVSKRHLLHQHLKVHGINITSQKQNGDVIDLDDISDEIEEVHLSNSTFDAQSFADIPLVWVSKGGKLSKMFKCRYCPHVNLRKVNIQEHEKMHSIREKSVNSSRISDVEHRCTECNYVCNNAGVLSSHTKVHQGHYGTIHCLVDPNKSDEEQIRDLSHYMNINMTVAGDSGDAGTMDFEVVDNLSENNDPMLGSILYFCKDCPARFFKENEFKIHIRFHDVHYAYKCEYCTYTARQKPYLIAHGQVHTNDYHKRTRELQCRYMCSYQPKLYPLTSGSNIIWKTVDPNNKMSELDIELENLNHMNKISKSSLNVPLSGTELFQQKSEAEFKHNAEKAAQQIAADSMKDDLPVQSETNFKASAHGNPKFIYPMYYKNGKMKEKRYKCLKCPSAFEKREQFKTHVGLHGSKQRYQCELCDYSVKYYANYVQHVKKHKMNADAHASLKIDDDLDEYEKSDSPVTNKDSAILEMEVTYDNKEEEKKLFWCPDCPYTNYRKDAVDNHQKRHINISGNRNNFTCDHCDYSVPQAHILREHKKIHFMSNKINSVDGFMSCDNLKLTSNKINENIKDNINDIIFEELGSKINDKSYLPPLNDDVSQHFNNNEGEKQLINVQTGEFISDKQTSDIKEEC